MFRSISLSLLAILLFLTACDNQSDDKPALKSSQRDEVTPSTKVETDDSVELSDNNISALPSKLIYVSDQTLYEMTADETMPEILVENASFAARSPQYNQILYLTESDPPQLTILNLEADLPTITLELQANEVIVDYQWSPSEEWLLIKTSDSENWRCMVWHTYDESQVVYAVDSVPETNIETMCQGLWLTDDNLLISSLYDNVENSLWIFSPAVNTWTEIETEGIEFPLNPFSTSFQEHMRTILENLGLGTLPARMQGVGVLLSVKIKISIMKRYLLETCPAVKFRLLKSLFSNEFYQKLSSKVCRRRTFLNSLSYPMAG